MNFGDKKIKKSDFYKNKKVTKIGDIDVNKILVSKEKPNGSKNSFKYLIWYNNDDVIWPLSITLPQIITMLIAVKVTWQFLLKLETTNW